jgi:hypothetical protein
MAEIHQLLLAEGRETVLLKARSAKERRVVEIASRILAEESEALGFSYAGFCMVSLPHRRLVDDTTQWYRDNGRFSLMIEPGSLIEGSRPRLYGVPYGARARMILLYLCTQAVRRDSRIIELGGSMREWLARVGIAPGGETYRSVREQAKRISACRLTIAWRGDNGEEGFKRENIIDGMLTVPSRAPGEESEETIEITESFFRALKAHPVPLWEPALQAISNSSLALDIYVWLVYRLHSLRKPTLVSWSALQAQFGPEYNRMRDFRRWFLQALVEAHAVYPGARVDVDRQGLRMLPSASATVSRPRQLNLINR